MDGSPIVRGQNGWSDVWEHQSKSSSRIRNVEWVPGENRFETRQCSKSIATRFIFRPCFSFTQTILWSLQSIGEELQGALEEWNDIFKKHGLHMNLDKTEVMWVGKQREELNIRLEEKYIKQVKNCVYLGGNISENGRVGVEVRRRIQAGANAWRNVEGVMVDRKISRKLKGKVLDSCVVPASTYGLETLALSELHQHKPQVCENNWIRKIAGVRRVERRRMKDLREEVGTKACIVGRIDKSRMKWAGHMVRMKEDKLQKRAETKKQEGSTKRGRPQLRWEDCVKRDLRKTEEEEKWREKANNRDRWKLITKVAVLRSDQ